ncbi:hypothetical protein MUA04_11020 [Enterobacteriaceae bacterium H11S18]|uniref:DUF6678 family protein n=1 Tax=Dryocola clanedunensis TaxID=2925396 RepID=UPI0022F0A726|nr:DUF6678 family protein [Dryocola clanedunensis]MCT4710718.1 hypothetical protein [Dryocola clanedunensis]
MLLSCMNETKWEEIRLAMAKMSPPPVWRTTSLNGYESLPDGDWYYHFITGGYQTIQYLDIVTSSPEQQKKTGVLLRAIHVVGIETAYGYRIFGYVDSSSEADYL